MNLNDHTEKCYEIDYFYKKTGEDVYYYWRGTWEKKWNKMLTYYTELPYAEWKSYDIK